jgi:hypothetical protein
MKRIVKVKWLEKWVEEEQEDPENVDIIEHSEKILIDFDALVPTQELLKEKVGQTNQESGVEDPSNISWICVECSLISIEELARVTE